MTKLPTGFRPDPKVLLIMVTRALEPETDSPFGVGGVVRARSDGYPTNYGHASSLDGYLKLRRP